MHYRHKAQQNGDEHAAFCELIRREKVRSYLEVGSFCGGSLWKVARVLPVGSRIVSVDLPIEGIVFPGTPPGPSLRTCVKELQSRGYDAHLIEGDSTDAKIVERARRLAPFDLCFIDANHDLSYVTKDWNNYGRMARIVAFHDISWDRPPAYPKKRMGVPVLWKELKSQFPKHQEIVLDAKKKDNGIGVLWRH